jgi:hypothetical protein
MTVRLIKTILIFFNLLFIQPLVSQHKLENIYLRAYDYSKQNEYESVIREYIKLYNSCLNKSHYAHLICTIPYDSISPKSHIL